MSYTVQNTEASGQSVLILVQPSNKETKKELKDQQDTLDNPKEENNLKVADKPKAEETETAKTEDGEVEKKQTVPAKAEVKDKPETLASKLTKAKKHARPVKLEDGRDWVHLYKFLSQKPDVAVLG